MIYIDILISIYDINLGLQFSPIQGSTMQPNHLQCTLSVMHIIRMHDASCIKMHNDSKHERSNPLHNGRPLTRCTANSRQGAQAHTRCTANSRPSLMAE